MPETEKEEVYAREKENAYVHAVYEEIAGHFSSTRYKPWPLVKSFLDSVPTGSVGVDAGCGNGKYLCVNKNIFMIGSDYSHELVKIASVRTDSRNNKNIDVIMADSLNLPHPARRFDFAISIAVIHHFSTKQRRIDAIKCILNLLKNDTGKALIYVWALEQASSRRGWSSSSEQDVLVPWVLSGSFEKSKDGNNKDKNNEKKSDENTKYRYYHLYKNQELENDIIQAGGITLDSGYERDNYWAIIKPNLHT